ncbi:MAG: HD domain-containing protein [Candidatus Nanohaloarchaea archaeon]
MTELNFLELFRDINEIKHKEREGWKKHGVETPRDTIASHSYGAAIIGWIVAEKHNLDSDKMVKMLLIHDLIMAHIPDVKPEDEGYESKKSMEMQKADELIQKMPEEIREEFKELFEEHQAEKTEFSQVANESDKIDTLLQSLLYSEQLEQNMSQEFINFYEEEFQTDTGKKIYQEIEKISSNLEE